MYQHYTGNKQFDLQLNRVCHPFEGDKRLQDDLNILLPKLNNISNWNRAWKEMAMQREAKGDYDLASSYYFAAGFYLTAEDKDWRRIRKKRVETFYKANLDLDFERYEVPFEGQGLPVIRFISESATKELLILTGYDGDMEELIDWFKVLRGGDYNLMLMEGPGQGSLVYKENSYFEADFERPVGAVLDYLGLNEVTILGLSWGGYFALRSAAFDKRIRRVIAFDIFYQGLDALTIDFPKMVSIGFYSLLLFRQKWLLNRIIHTLMKYDDFLAWKVKRGIQLTGEKTPYNLIRAIQQHSLTGILNQITQEVLLLAGDDDQYVPIKRLSQMEKELVNAERVNAVSFSEVAGGQYHCQAGTDLGLQRIIEFLKE